MRHVNENEKSSLSVFLAKKVKIAFNDGRQIVTKYGIVEAVSDGLVLLQYRDGKKEAISAAGIVRIEEWV